MNKKQQQQQQIYDTRYNSNRNNNNKTQRTRNPKNSFTTTCKGCNIPIIMWLSKFRQSTNKSFFHSQDCYYNFRRSNAKSTKFITINCSGCNIPITMYKSTYDYHNSKNHYHDKNCFHKHNTEFKGSPSRRYVYLDHYRCRNCGKFIKKTETRTHSTKNGKTYPVCPDVNCGNYQLQTKPRHKRTYRKRLKEEEERKNNEQQQLLKIPV